MLPHQNILLCLRWGIGDVVMQTPLVSALRRAAPTARITALGAAPATDLLRGDPRLDVVRSTREFGIHDLWQEGDVVRVSEWLAQQDFDLILDPHAAAASVSSSIWRLRTEIRESDQTAEKRRLLAGGSGTQALIEGARYGWGVAVPQNASARLHISPAARERAAALLGACRRAPVAVAPFASSPLKEWPLARFTAVARRAARRAPVLIVSTPDSPSAQELEEQLAGVPRVHRLPPVPLDVLAAVLRRCAALVCNDTGVMHIAAAVDTPVVSVFGPTDPVVYAPRGRRHMHVGGSDITCEYRRPHVLGTPACWASGHCLLADSRSCIDRVQVSAVTRACERALDGRRVRSLAE